MNKRAKDLPLRMFQARRRTFEEYCGMREYQNIMLKMLVKDKFPYTDCGELTRADLQRGIEILDQFVFIGMNEM